MVAAKLATLAHGQKKADAPIGASTQADAAELLNVSRRAVQRAAVVQDEGAPELIAAVERGDVAVSAAAQVAALPREVQAVASVTNSRQRAPETGEAQ